MTDTMEAMWISARMLPGLPAMFAQWQAGAIRYERELQAQGQSIYRAIVDPDEYAAWCLDFDGKPHNADSLLHFAGFLAFRDDADLHATSELKH